MKSVLFTLIIFVTAVASADVEAPSDAVLQEVATKARELGFTSYGTIVCLDIDNSRIVLGGATGWPFGTQIYAVSPSGTITPTTTVSEDGMMKNLKLHSVSGDMDLTLSDPKQTETGLLKQDAVLTIGAAENSQKLTCFTRLSGLE